MAVRGGPSRPRREDAQVGHPRPAAAPGRRGDVRLIVGVTGSIGAGKTAVARLFEGLGARRLDADALAREAVAPGTPAHARIVEAFGRGVLAPDGAIDRPALGRLAFADEAAWRQLCEIVHPPVVEAARAAIAADPAADWALDVPLLYESGMDSLCDVVVVVAAPRDVRYDRLVRRGVDAAEAARREAFQMPEEEKRRRADRVIENDGSAEALRRAAVETWENLKRRER